MSAWTVVLMSAFAAGLLAWALSRSTPRLAAELRARADHIADGELADAFIFIEGRRLLQFSAAAAGLVTLLAALSGAGPAGMSGVALAALVTPRVLLRKLRQRRQRRLVRQLPDAMQALASLLQAGNSLPQALARLAETQPRPLRDEWRLLLRGLRMGERSDAVFEQLARRIDAPEARLLATTVRVALDLGGSVAEALNRLADSLRRRLDMLERIRALTAQGRLQGAIVGVLPLLVLLALLALDGEAMSLLWTTFTGWAAIALLVVLELCGFVLIRRIVNIDV